MTKTFKGLRINLGLAAAALIVSVAVWQNVPSPMPVHWDAAGQPNGFAPRALGLLLMPALIALMAPFILWMTGKRVETGKGKKAVRVITVSSSGFLLGMHVLMVQAAMSTGGVLSMGAMMSLLGVLFVVLGAVLPMLPQNEVAGVRTPWTLASEMNWKLTHRFGAWTMVIGGVLCIVAGALLSGQVMFWVGFAAIMVGSLLPVAYAYLLSKVQKDRL